MLRVDARRRRRVRTWRVAERQRAAVAGDPVPAGREPGRLHLESLERRVDVAGRAAGAGLLAEHGPRLEGVSYLDLDVAAADGTVARKTEVVLCGEPVDAEREPGALEVRDHLDEVRPDEVRQEEAVVEQRAPADERASVRLLPEPGDEGSHEELLHEAHARVRWHLEAAELDEAEPAARRLGGVQLVDAELGPVRVAGDVHQEVS